MKIINTYVGLLINDKYEEDDWVKIHEVQKSDKSISLFIEKPNIHYPTTIVINKFKPISKDNATKLINNAEETLITY